MTALIGVTTVWSMETWGEVDDQPGGILYSPVQYHNALYNSGGLPVLVAPPTLALNDEDLQAVAKKTADSLYAFFFSGGGGNRRFKNGDMPNLEEQQPQRYKFEAMLIREAWKRKMPVIGACRGHQMIIEALGGKIKGETVSGHQQDEKAKTGHGIKIAAGSKLASLVGSLNWTVNSMHCQVAEEVPAHFQVSARSPEGYIEAVEAEEPHFWMGFQFHPEAMVVFDEAARAVIKAFVDAAEEYGKRR